VGVLLLTSVTDGSHTELTLFFFFYDSFDFLRSSSFQHRQLNLYGFSRLTAGRDKGAYYHAFFIRGERALCRNMVRQKIKGTKVRRTLAPEEEPDFYAMAAKAKKAAAKAASTAVSTTSSSNHKKKSEQQQRMPSLTGKERAIKEHRERMNTVRDVLKQTEDLCNFDASDFDQFLPLKMPELHFDGQDPSAVAAAPVISPMDSVASDAEDEDELEDDQQQAQQQGGDDAGRSSMANLPWTIGGHQVPFSISLPSSVMDTPSSFFGQPLTRRVSVATAAEASPRSLPPRKTSSPTLSQLQQEIASSGDVLFFEGKPFHYLEHFESIPPAPVKTGGAGGYVVQKTTTTKDNTVPAQYQNYQPRDSLQSLMRVDPQAIMGGAYQRFTV